MNILNNFCTLEEAAARRGCSRATIWRRIQSGDLTGRRVLGRLLVRVEEVDLLEIPKRRHGYRSSKEGPE